MANGEDWSVGERIKFMCSNRSSASFNDIKTLFENLENKAYIAKHVLEHKVDMSPKLTAWIYVQHVIYSKNVEVGKPKFNCSMSDIVVMYLKYSEVTLLTFKKLLQVLDIKIGRKVWTFIVQCPQRNIILPDDVLDFVCNHDIKDKFEILLTECTNGFHPYMVVMLRNGIIPSINFNYETLANACAFDHRARKTLCTIREVSEYYRSDKFKQYYSKLFSECHKYDNAEITAEGIFSPIVRRSKNIVQGDEFIERLEQLDYHGLIGSKIFNFQ